MFRTIIFRTTQQDCNCIRFIHKENQWTLRRKKKLSTDKALAHFDDFYKQVYGATNWTSIRKALLAKQKYVAVVNNYSDSEEICKRLEARAAINVRSIFHSQRDYLREQGVQVKRKDALARVWQAAEEAKEEQPVTPVDYSLEGSLRQAEIDETRAISAYHDVNLQEFIPATKIKGREDFIYESQHFKYYEKTKDFPVKIVQEHDVNFPESLNVYCYEEENFTQFPQPKKGSTGVLDYYLMDGGSVLPVLALDLQPGVRVLDVCSAPGGKSLVALQTLFPETVVCNDVSVSRTGRIVKVFDQYLYDFKTKWMDPGRIRITSQDARWMKEDRFDRVLVDVPCTTDRHSANEDDNNIFRADRIKERLQLPEVQSEILFNAMRLVKVGGVVVYSTCSLSPIQNDGVVHMALKRLWEETQSEMVIKDLNPALRQAKHVFRMAAPKLLRYGHLVLPSTSQNYGPTYFCKLVKVC